MTIDDFTIGERVLNGDRIMIVYLETSLDGEVYKALRSSDGTIYNGDLQRYIDGFWGGIKKL